MGNAHIIKIYQKFYFLVDLNRETPPKIPKLIKPKIVLGSGVVGLLSQELPVHWLSVVSRKVSKVQAPPSGSVPLDICKRIPSEEKLLAIASLKTGVISKLKVSPTERLFVLKLPILAIEVA